MVLKLWAVLVIGLVHYVTGNVQIPNLIQPGGGPVVPGAGEPEVNGTTTTSRPNNLIQPGGDPVVPGAGEPEVDGTTTTSRPKVPATYSVTFSTKIRPGMTFPVTVHLFKSGDVTNVEVSLRNSSNESIVFASAPVVSVTGGDGGQVINLDIPRTLTRPVWNEWFEYILRVVAYGDVSFNKSEALNFDEKSFSVFVQTDKAMYKPGETVKFRALAMKPDLIIMNEPMDIFIWDSAGNGVKKWTGVYGFENTGVVELQLPTSAFCSKGDWKIDVTVLGVKETKTFTIAEYILPKFEVILEVPKVLHLSEKAVLGKVSAKYTFGKPLTDADVLITVKSQYFYSRWGNESQPFFTLTGKLNSKGEMPFSIYQMQLQELQLDTESKTGYYGDQRENFDPDTYLNYKSFSVIVNVTDTRTGHQMGDDADFRFTHERAQVTVLPITSNSYKPGLKYSVFVSVTKNDESLFENYKNINVTINVTMEVPQSTTTSTSTTSTTTITPEPMTTANETDQGGLDLRPVEEKIILGRPGRWFPRYEPTDTVEVMTMNKTLTSNGFLQFDVDVPSIASTINVNVEVLGSSAYHSASKAESASGNFMQIQSNVEKPQVGQMARFSVKTTEPVNEITYQLYAKGILLTESKALASDDAGQIFFVSFEVTNKMAPNCRILVFYFRQDGEVVADSLSFKVTISAGDQVGVSYSKAKVKPGENVDLKVSARQGSVVFLLGVDKSVQLLKSGNDITQGMVDEEIMQYDFGGRFGSWHYMVVCGWPFPSRGSDAFSVFRDANVALLTDGDVYRKPVERYYGYGGGFMASPMLMRSSSIQGQAKLDLESSAAPVERVRTSFPETWLWDMALVGSSGSVLLPQTAPDTITTWLTSAFAVHPTYGFSVVSAPAELITFRDVFVSLDLPYSAVRGEDLCLKAFAFNYFDQALYMRLVMGRNDGISNIRLLRKSWDSLERIEHRVPMEVTHRIGKVYPDSIAESTFCFTPNVLGEMTLQVNLTATTIPGDVFPGDGVEHKLLVKAEGVPRAQTQSVILDLKNGQPFLKTVPIQFPADAVHGSQRITVSVAGDLLGSVMANVDDLLKMPYGCGEQNMLNFAPNVYVIDYLQKTDTYTKETAQKAESYMMTGYQKELSYQHKDGSYSTFGEHNNATGSMWLTAFVVKCFAQSMSLKGDVINVDPNVVQSSLRWMMNLQQKNGSFIEPGTVFNKNMQGGSGTGEALTAYVLIALAEARNNMVNLDAVFNEMLQDSMGRGVAYLELQLDGLHDPYDLAIVTYALHLTNSARKDAAFSKLLSNAVTESLMLHWERPKSEAEKRQYFYWQRNTDAINIEATAYGLLTLLLRGDIEQALPVVRWLTGQRGPQGGFISTQDTVIGLQGLAQIATIIYQPTFTPISVRVNWSANGRQQTETITLDDSSKQLLQNVYVPIVIDIPTDVTIHAQLVGSNNFTGMAVAEVTLDYNVLEPTTSVVPTEAAVFTLTPKVYLLDENTFLLNVIAARVDGKVGGMTNIKVGIPTGYDVDESHKLWNTGGASMAEIDNGQYVLYFNEIGPTPVNVTVPMIMSRGVTVNSQPVAIQIVDYYESGGNAQMTVNYKLPKVNFICERQPNYESCPYHTSGKLGRK